jgi:hypothetical protein
MQRIARLQSSPVLSRQLCCVSEVVGAHSYYFETPSRHQAELLRGSGTRTLVDMLTSQLD